MSRGFTLIEVLVVVAIICILMSVVLAAFDEAGGGGERPCSDYGRWAVDDVPARCASYFGITK